ncbi:MAG TPA: zf-HC2 domain-containing protein [Symbiobacteriaceae bacterium]|nr:zf-HC2 domain-containing protein [Symbiobacteriaceae bacterium]
MQCDQIRQYLTAYVDGTLPGYKTAWVIQHLAGCQACAAAVAAERRAAEDHPVPMAAAVEPEARRQETNSEAVQRPVPAGVQVAAAVLLIAAAGGAFWLLVST